MYHDNDIITFGTTHVVHYGNTFGAAIGDRDGYNVTFGTLTTLLFQ